MICRSFCIAVNSIPIIFSICYQKNNHLEDYVTHLSQKSLCVACFGGTKHTNTQITDKPLTLHESFVIVTVLTTALL